jgi:hypothetical protein
MTTQTISNPPALCTEDNAAIDQSKVNTALTPDYNLLNSSIKETFTAEWH